jgi:hypothetical protein
MMRNPTISLEEPLLGIPRPSPARSSTRATRWTRREGFAHGEAHQVCLSAIFADVAAQARRFTFSIEIRLLWPADARRLI